MNQLTDAGLKRLAVAVPQSGLAHLHVANNSVTEAGARALVDAAMQQHKLVGRTVNISGISDSVLAAARRRCPSGVLQAQPPVDKSGDSVSGDDGGDEPKCKEGAGGACADAMEQDE